MFFDNEFGASSNSMGLLRAASNPAVEAFVLWQQEVCRSIGAEIQARPLSGSMRDLFNTLLPVVTPVPTRHCFVQLREGWTMYLNNFRLGTDAAGVVRVLSERLQTDAARVDAADQLKEASSNRVRQYGATIFEYYRLGHNLRTIYSANDGGRWKFNAYGEPFTFEALSDYSQPRIRDRFTKQTLFRYLANLGLDFENPDALRAPDGLSFLVERVGNLGTGHRTWPLEPQ